MAERSRAKDPDAKAVKQAKRSFEVAARIGYAARGIVYLTVGGIGLAAALTGGRPAGTPDALGEVMARPFGFALLGTIAAGLVCFGGWRLLQGFLDSDHHGKGLKALARRVSYGLSSIFYFALAAWAVSLIFGAANRSDDASAREWSSWLLTKPGGIWLLVAIGAGIVAGGIASGIRGCTANLRTRLEATAGARRWVVMLGRFGFLARAIVLILVGVFLIAAAWQSKSSEVVGLGGALRAIQHRTYGDVLLAIATLGLFAFGSFQMTLAFIRRIDVPKGALPKRG